LTAGFPKHHQNFLLLITDKTRSTGHKLEVREPGENSQAPRASFILKGLHGGSEAEWENVCLGKSPEEVMVEDFGLHEAGAAERCTAEAE
jgi:hypothetical protein